MFNNRARMTLFSPFLQVGLKRNFSDLKVPTIRWVALFQSRKPYMKFLNKAKNDYYTTEIDSDSLKETFGSCVYNDFFSPGAIVDLSKLYFMEYDKLNDIEKRQRTALEKELSDTIDSLRLTLQVSKCVHERDIDSLKILLETKKSPSLYYNIMKGIGLGDNFYRNFSLLGSVGENEMTFLTEPEFSHYPFLAPFKYKDLKYITSAIQEKLEEMPKHSATVLGTIPVALTMEQITEMDLSIEIPNNGENPSYLYLFNIAIVTAGNHAITLVPKRVKSHIDVRYPIAKYINHEGNTYEPQTGAQDPTGSHPTLESREKLYLNYTNIPLVNIKEQAARITKISINNQNIYIVPEICLEHRNQVARSAVEQELADNLPFPMYFMHALIASGVPNLMDESMIADEIFINDNTVGGARIFDNNHYQNILPELTSSKDAKLQIAIFPPRTLSMKNTLSLGNK